MGGPVCHGWAVWGLQLALGSWLWADDGLSPWVGFIAVSAVDFSFHR